MDNDFVLLTEEGVLPWHRPPGQVCPTTLAPAASAGEQFPC